MNRWPRHPTPEQAALVDTSNGWDRTPRGKLICPTCAATGWPRGSWIWKHVAHDPTPCGREVAHGYLGTHVAHCRDCR